MFFYPLDYHEMNKGIRYFIGTHDFTSFMSANSNVDNPIRRIDQSFLSREGDLIIFSIEGNGFFIQYDQDNSRNIGRNWTRSDETS